MQFLSNNCLLVLISLQYQTMNRFRLQTTFSVTGPDDIQIILIMQWRFQIRHCRKKSLSLVGKSITNESFYMVSNNS
jgi:hypothetical protein